MCYESVMIVKKTRKNFPKKYVFQVHCLITKRAQNQEKYAILLVFRVIFFAKAQQAQVLTVTLIFTAL